MKGFKKLALAAAVASLPAAGLAMQPMADEELSDVIGQDGISLEITADVDVDLAWEDTSGVAGAVERGMVYLPGFNIDGTIEIDIDAGSTNAGVAGGVLQIAIRLPDITASNFEVYVSGSSDAGANYDGADGLSRFEGVATRVATDTPAISPVVSLGAITLAGLDLTVQLGEDAAQFALIETAAPISIDVTNLVIVDEDLGGSLHVAELSMEVDPDGTTIGIDDSAGGGAAGLVINAPASDQTIAMMNVGFGNGTAQTSGIGNLYTSVSPNAATQIIVRGRP
jgi:hypothetical protein